MTAIVIISIVVALLIIYKLISNNYSKRMALITKGQIDIGLNGYAIMEVSPTLLLGTLKTEGYQTYVSPVSLGFLHLGKEILVMSTSKNNSLAIEVSKMGDMSDSELESLISNN